MKDIFAQLMDESPEAKAKFNAAMNASIAEGKKHQKEVIDRFVEQAVSPLHFGQKQGPFLAPSILAWTEIARLAKVPYIAAAPIATIPIEDAWNWIDNKPISDNGDKNIKEAMNFANRGGFWRTDICAGEEVKYCMGSGKPLPDKIYFNLDDPRIMDMHRYLPHITVVGRPRMTPQYINGYPVEFRVFILGQVNGHSAVSFYYPQAGKFDVTDILQKAMDKSVLAAHTLWSKMIELGLTPWLPEQGEPDLKRGCSLDFMLLNSGEVTLVDAGPGLGSGAHPCCFLDTEAAGQRWHVAEGVEIR